jgi:hypothetical protein
MYNNLGQIIVNSIKSATIDRNNKTIPSKLQSASVSTDTPQIMCVPVLDTSRCPTPTRHLLI